MMSILTVDSKWRAWTATVATIALAGSFAVMELILILTLQVSYQAWSSGAASLTIPRDLTVEVSNGL